MAANHQNNTNMENYTSRPLNQPVTAKWANIPESVQLKLVKVTLSDQTEPRTELHKGQRASYTKQNTFAQLLFHIRFAPLKLPRNALKVVTGSPRELLKILINESPDNLFVRHSGSWWCITIPSLDTHSVKSWTFTVTLIMSIVKQFFTWQSSLGWCTIKLSLVQKGSAVQSII